MKTDERAITAKNLRQYRLVKGLKQKELAAKVGLSTDTISKIELGKQENIGMKYLVSICRELDVELYQLFLEDPEALTLKFVVSDQNLRHLERLSDEVVKRLDNKKGINIYILK